MWPSSCPNEPCEAENHPNGEVPQLLEVRNLRTSFVTGGGEFAAVDGISLSIPCGKTVALVGESGCGKSVTALSIMRLIPQPPGRIVDGEILLSNLSGRRAPDGVARSRAARPWLDTSTACSACGGSDRATPNEIRPTKAADDHVDLVQLTEKQVRKIRGSRIAIIFQDPLVSLNPVFTVGEQIVEAIELHQPLRGKDAWSAAVDMLRKVGIPAPRQRAYDYPHQMSGGMRQRTMIAMALSCRPSLLIADEPTTALDVTIQQQILELLRSLQADTGMSILLITHDLGVVAQIADYGYVMYAGRIVEHAPVSALLSNPLHPYTKGLLRCMPRLAQRRERLEVIPGAVPDPADWPSGCRFHPRCRLSAERACNDSRNTVPVDTEVGDAVLHRCVETYADEPSGQPELRELQPHHHVACWESP